jgi:hypothetical protein
MATSSSSPKRRTHPTAPRRECVSRARQKPTLAVLQPAHDVVTSDEEFIPR